MQEKKISNPVHKFVEVHEEIVRRKNENTKIEEALFQVVPKEKKRQHTFNQDDFQRKHSFKKIWNIFKKK